MSGQFEQYKQRKGMWFWMMLSIAEVVSNDPDISARKTDYLVKDFLESNFFKIVVEEHNKTDQMIKFIR